MRNRTKKTNPTKYGIINNSFFMFKTAFENVPSVPLLTLFQALLAVAISVLELYVAPTILKRLEIHSSLKELLFTILFFTLGIMGVAALNAYLKQNLLPGRCEIRGRITCMLSKKSGTCSYPLLENRDFNKLFSKALNSTSSSLAPTEAIWNTFAQILQNVLGFLIYLYLLTNVDWLIITITTAAALISYFVSSRLNGWGYRHRQEESDIINRFDYIRNKSGNRYLAKDIRIFGMEKWLRELLHKYLKLHQDFCLKREKIYLIADFTDLGLSILRNGFAYAYLLHMVLEGQLSAAEFLLYFTAVSGFTTWISGIMESLSTLHKQSIDMVSVRELIDYPEVFSLDEGEPLVPAQNTSYTIELRDVSFRYPESEKVIFSHLNLTIHAGEKLAVVGLNGAGKTTLIKLICGFYDPDEGEVLLNGVNIKTYRRRDYYLLFAGVFQSFSLHADDIAVNVAQTNENIDMDRVWHCLEQAGIKNKIETLPNGIHTHLVREVYEDAAELSGGELQRLMLARLLYKDSPVVVLDEPTAALDAIAESDIYMRYHELTKGRTAVFISHRLASTRFCDRILLLADGGIAEEGTHEELMRLNGVYAELFEIQSKYYRKGVQENNG